MYACCCVVWFLFSLYTYVAGCCCYYCCCRRRRRVCERISMCWSLFLEKKNFFLLCINERMNEKKRRLFLNTHAHRISDRINKLVYILRSFGLRCCCLACSRFCSFFFKVLMWNDVIVACCYYFFFFFFFLQKHEMNDIFSVFLVCKCSTKQSKKKTRRKMYSSLVSNVWVCVCIFIFSHFFYIIFFLLSKKYLAMFII